MSIYNSFLAPCKWLSGILAKGTALFVILTAVITFFVPGAFKWVEGTTQTIILGVIMLSMGLTLGKQDFVILAKRPFDIFVGAIGQFTIMPFLAWIITRIFNLPSDLAVGLILVGCVPGGVSSNIMSFLCHGDLAFSVGMTTASTLIAPVMTPLLIGYLCSGQHVDVDPMGMIMFLLYVTIIPVALGAFLNMTMSKRKSFADIKACIARSLGYRPCLHRRRRRCTSRRQVRQHGSPGILLHLLPQRARLLPRLRPRHHLQVQHREEAHHID